VKSFPYRETIGVLLVVMLHTVPQIIFILNVLSRYCKDPGPRQVFFLQHLIRYMKGIRFDTIHRINIASTVLLSLLNPFCNSGKRLIASQ
jgi:hypothetical protein